MDVDFEEWAAGRLPSLLRYAHLLTGDRHRAEDVVQTAFTRMLVAWPRVQRKDDPEGYIRKAITRLAIDSRKKAWRERLTATPPEASIRSMPLEEDRWEMWALLATLPSRQRAVVVLRYYEDLSEAQIAEVLGCSRGTVKSQASKALAKLRARFEAVEVAK